MSLSEPFTVCVLLTRDRPKMSERALRCFRAQSYKRKHLLIYDTGDYRWYADRPEEEKPLSESHCFIRGEQARSVGWLRNAAAEIVPEDSVIVHLDSDDWSSPSRLTEQVALLQSSGAECVGYNEMLFWDTRIANGEAWRYRLPIPTYACGTSLCYWRKTWERVKFPDLVRGEDTFWLDRVKCLGVSGIVDSEPRLIATLHGGNTGSQIVPGTMEWNRAPEYDDKVRGIMERA